MPRKRSPDRISEYKIPDIKPGDRTAVEDHHLVGHALVDFDEIGVLSSRTREQLTDDLVDAIRFARGGVPSSQAGAVR